MPAAWLGTLLASHCVLRHLGSGPARVFLEWESISKGPSPLDSGWGHRCRDGEPLSIVLEGRGSGMPWITLHIMGSVPYKGEAQTQGSE